MFLISGLWLRISKDDCGQVFKVWGSYTTLIFDQIVASRVLKNLSQLRSFSASNAISDPFSGATENQDFTMVI